MAVIDCLDDPDETLKRKTLELLFRMTNPSNAEAVVEKLLFFLEQAVDPFLRADLVTRIVQLADRYAPSNLWFVETMIRLFSIAGDLVDSEASQNLLRLLAEGVEPTEDDEEEAERESAKMRKRACSLLLDSLRKPHAAEVLMKCAFWSLGEYGFLLSTKLPNGHKKNSEAFDDDVLRVDEDEEEENDDDEEVVPLEKILQIICEVVDGAGVANPATKAYGITAISKITAQIGVLIPKARESLERFSISRHTELQQRCGEFLFLMNEPAKLPTLFPVDASCEDFDNVDFSFFDEFSEILRAAGASEYQEHLRVTNDYDFEGGGLLSASASPSHSGGSKAAPSKLRFDAYEPPKLFETTITPPVEASFSVDDLSRMVASGTGISAPGPSISAGSTKPNVKSVWGPKGYMGSLPSLGGAVPSQQSQPSDSPTASVTSSSTAPPPYLQTGGTPDYDFGASAAEEQSLEDLRPPPPPPKKPEMSEKEKAAQALFGGLGGGSKGASRSAKQNSSSSQRQAPTAQQQPQTKKTPTAPPPDLFSMEGDLLGVGSSPALAPNPSAAPAAKPAPSATDSLFDLFSAPNSFMPAQSTPPVHPLTPPSLVLGPRQMDTAHFGTLWPSHSAEARVSVRTNNVSFRDFLNVFSSRIGARLVEFIPATQEAIFAGDASPQDVVLVHAKDRGMGTVDLMLRSKQPFISEKVARACRETVF
jgi:AP-4 complex subunit epsilon-1